MKKVMKISLLLFFLFAFSSSVSAISIIYKYQPINTDVQPQNVDGRILVPIRAVTDALNGTITWDGENQTIEISKDDLKITLKIGDRKAIVGNEVVELDVPAQIISGRTLVPLRFVSEHFGHRVDWDGENQRVLIDSVALLLDIEDFSIDPIRDPYGLEGFDRFVYSELLPEMFGEIDLENADWYLSHPDNDFVDPNIWISDDELTMKTELIFSKTLKGQGEWNMAFIKTSPLTGTVLEVVYEVPDMPQSYLDDKNDSEDTFNGIRFKKVNGNLYFSREDLKNKGILQN